jgi:hypothetical protein
MTPPCVLDQDGLLARRGLAALVLDLLEDADGLDVLTNLLLGPALTDRVLIGNAIVRARALRDLLLGLLLALPDRRP